MDATGGAEGSAWGPGVSRPCPIPWPPAVPWAPPRRAARPLFGQVSSPMCGWQRHSLRSLPSRARLIPAPIPCIPAGLLCKLQPRRWGPPQLRAPAPAAVAAAGRLGAPCGPAATGRALLPCLPHPGTGKTASFGRFRRPRVVPGSTRGPAGHVRAAEPRGWAEQGRLAEVSEYQTEPFSTFWPGEASPGGKCVAWTFCRGPPGFETLSPHAED